MFTLADFLKPAISPIKLILAKPLRINYIFCKVDSKIDFTEIINTGTDLVIKVSKRFNLDIIKFTIISRSTH